MSDFYQGRDPRDIGAYSVAEAAQYVRMPTATLRTWVGARALIVRPRGSQELSFTNLIEAHVLSALRSKHRIAMPRVRTAVAYVEKVLGVSHPLAHHEFATDGLDLFIEQLGDLINASRHGQVAIREAFERRLARIERDTHGLAMRFFPLTRPSEDGPRIIVVDPRISFGRPIIADKGVPTSAIADRYDAGESVDDLMVDYGCERVEVEEAIRCEHRKAA